MDAVFSSWPARMPAHSDRRSWCLRAAFYLAWWSAVSVVASIAVSQILLGMAFAAILVSGAPLRFPPVKLPLVLFFGITVVAILASGAPLHGWPQLRKFYVFLLLPVVFTTFTETRQIRSMVLGWSVVAAVSGAAGMVQMARLLLHASRAQLQDYGYFLYNRPTGLSSHWMTFGGEEMIVLLALLALLFFDSERRGKWLGCICAPILFVGLTLSLTRSVFLVGFPAGAIYLLWRWNRKVVWLAPLAATLLLVAPMPIRERVRSAFEPHRGMDSNAQRVVTVRTGLAMVRAHPWLGLGPEEIAGHFQEYVPKDIPRPLPVGWYGHLHNIYLQYAAERGIPGMLLMMWFLGKVLVDAARSAREGDAAGRFIFHSAIAIVLAVLAEGFFEYNLGDSEVLSLFLTAVACMYVMRSGNTAQGVSRFRFLERGTFALKYSS
ncbi:MAG TPA: O-antigen ligase family protein [Bryobacteraceae bacterium]|nr:O-antigen ligase family protein [Bryobacteraceae bacterium]